jgi:thiol-disulfide isomerase/thioredoxin
MKRSFMLFLLLGFGLNLSRGQSGVVTAKMKTKSPIVKQLKIGDHLPDIIIPDMINYPKKTLRLSDLKGKYVILDFWHNGCSSCIAGFPKMQKLQNKYSKQLQVILVNFQPENLIRDFVVKQKENAGFILKMPIACNDKKLNTCFKPPSYPHYVWIDRKGIVRFVTYAYDVTEEHVEAFINDRQLNMEEKNDVKLDYVPYKPLFINGNGGNESTTRACSILSTSKISMSTTTSYYSPGDSNSYIEAIGWPVKGLFQAAFNDYLNGWHLLDNRTILEVKDSSKYVWKINGVYHWENCYAYQLFVPYQSAEALKKMMQADLMRYFGLDAHMEKRIMKCWVLTAEDTSLLMTRGGEIQNDMSDANFTLKLRNLPQADLETRFIYNFFGQSQYPFIYDILMKSNVDIFLDKVHFDDLNDLIQAFKKYKLNVRLEDHAIDILVITEPGYQPISSQ